MWQRWAATLHIREITCMYTIAVYLNQFIFLSHSVWSYFFYATLDSYITCLSFGCLCDSTFCNASQRSREQQTVSKLDLTDTIKDGTRLFLIDERIRRQLLLALTEDSKLHIQEVSEVYRLLILRVNWYLTRAYAFAACRCIQIARGPNRRTFSSSASSSR